jgi:outer membrane protein assembly factor BamD
MKACKTLLLIIALAVLPGCALLDVYFLPPPEDTAQELFEAGDEAMRQKEFDDAAEYFTMLRDRYPFSPYTPQAELMLGDAYYLDEDYSQAEEAYKDFESLHPGHEQIDYVIFQIGMSNYKQFASVDLPQENSGEALEYFTRLVEAYPDSEYVEEARKAIVKSRLYLAEHEIFVADFYWRAERYGSAYRRYTYVVDNFSDLPEVREYAEKRAELSYLRYREQDSNAERERIEGSWKQWFDWL